MSGAFGHLATIMAPMRLDIQPGSYVVAVSGGIDSMVLLDMLAHMPGLELTVAHFEHGIREDADADRELVENATVHYGLPFICEHGSLGPGAGEAAARSARYAFLGRVKEKVQARAVITAHHQDDMVETAVINLLRGTGRKGLSSLQSTDNIIRPFLHFTKQQLYDYAKQRPTITWRDDSTNNSDQYLRNYVRHHIISGLGIRGRARLLQHIRRAAESNSEIDAILLATINEQIKDGMLNRRWFTMLPYAISCEVMAAWLRAMAIREFDRRKIERLVVAAKVAIPGRQLDINAGYLLEVRKYGLRIRPRSLSR